MNTELKDFETLEDAVNWMEKEGMAFLTTNRGTGLSKFEPAKRINFLDKDYAIAVKIGFDNRSYDAALKSAEISIADFNRHDLWLVAWKIKHNNNQDAIIVYTLARPMLKLETIEEINALIAKIAADGCKDIVSNIKSYDYSGCSHLDAVSACEKISG